MLFNKKSTAYFMSNLSFSRILIGLCSVLFLMAHQASAQGKGPDPATDTLMVGIAGNEPFVIRGNGANPDGIAIDIWEDLASEKGWSYRYKPFSTVDAALQSLSGGEVDLIVGPVSITSQRVVNMRFSQPYYQSSLALMSRLDKPSLWDRVKPLFSFKLLLAVGAFVIILAIVGTLLWFAERKESPEQFPADPLKGIGNGMWLAIVTMSTTGYGDIAPITLRGRIIAGSWMVISIIFATSMVAGIASTLTLSALGSSTITNVEQLAGKKAATISGSSSEAFLNEHNIQEVPVNDLNEAVNKLKNREVDAVVYDRPQLLYHLENNKDESLHVANAEYSKQGYGIAFPLNSDLVYGVNRTLLELAEEHTVAEIIESYLGKNQ